MTTRYSLRERWDNSYELVDLESKQVMAIVVGNANAQKIVVGLELFDSREDHARATQTALVSMHVAISTLEKVLSGGEQDHLPLGG